MAATPREAGTVADAGVSRLGRTPIVFGRGPLLLPHRPDEENNTQVVSLEARFHHSLLRLIYTLQ